MSNIAIKGATTGTGTFTIESPATNTDRTLTLPDEAGTVLTSASDITQNSGPAFSAYQSSAQSVTLNTWVKVNLQAEEFDTDNCFDSTTNYRFTPNVAGYYQVQAHAYVASTRTYVVASIYKNGSIAKVDGSGNATTNLGGSVSSLVYLNGTTDYIEFYVLIGVSQNLVNTAKDTYFQASLVRAA